ncbi:MAG: hypothetical protein U5R31_16415 [Acidimicrobiia bacterium]|nr:hypothetical protein [Acidimicrobiia bacterium]
MAKNRASFERRAREKAKKEKADAKRARRQQRDDEKAESDDESVSPTTAARENADLQDRLAALHQRFDDNKLTADEFAEQRDALLEQIHVD